MYLFFEDITKSYIIFESIVLNFKIGNFRYV